MLKRLTVHSDESFYGLQSNTLPPDYDQDPPIFACRFSEAPGYQHVLALANEDGRVAIQVILVINIFLTLSSTLPNRSRGILKWQIWLFRIFDNFQMDNNNNEVIIILHAFFNVKMICIIIKNYVFFRLESKVNLRCRKILGKIIFCLIL